MTKKVCAVVVLALVATAGVWAQTEADFKTQVNEDGGVTITKYTGWDTDITIPAKIGGKAVTAIGGFENAGLTGVVIPNGVTVEGLNAFSGNPLTKLTLGKDVHIGRETAFSGNRLTSVTLGSDCLIPDMSFGYFVFFSYMCNGRKAGSYKIDTEWDKNWGSRPGSDNWNKVRKTAENYIYAETPYGLAITGFIGVAGRLSIPDKLNGKPVKYVGSLGYNDGLTGVLIPDSVVSIGDKAFYYAPLSSGASIGKGVTYIGAEAFSGCRLTSITIPNGVTYIGAEAFYNNELTSVTIPNSVVYIGNRAFLGSQLTSITIPANVSLGEHDFKSAYESNGKKAGTYLKDNTYGWGTAAQIQAKTAADNAQKEAEEAEEAEYLRLAQEEEHRRTEKEKEQQKRKEQEATANKAVDLLDRMTYLNIAGTQSNSELEKKGMNSASYDTFVELYKLYLEYQKLVTDDTAVQRLVKVMRSSTEEEIQRKINRYYPYLTKKQQAVFEKQFGKPAQ